MAKKKGKKRKIIIKELAKQVQDVNTTVEFMRTLLFDNRMGKKEAPNVVVYCVDPDKVIRNSNS